MNRFYPILREMVVLFGKIFGPLWKKIFVPLWKLFVRFWKRKHLTQITLLTGLVVLLVTISYFGWLASRVNVQMLQQGLSQPTVIYDKDGNVATTISTNRITGVSIKEMPKYVPNAIVAIEDERFYQHGAIDIRGIARAAFANLLHGGVTEGGSTLTQQLAKNALLSSQRTFSRKLEELFLAVKLEKYYTKDQILQMYLNQVYFGDGAWGIGDAAKKYFDKSIKDVTISEAAMLAGLPNAPGYLDPYIHYNAAIQRRNLVLAKMKQLGMITAAQYQTALNEKIQLHDGGGSNVERKYPYYVDAVIDEAISKYGLTQEDILTRGYRIYTEMDQNIQSSLEQVYKRDDMFPSGMGGKMVQSGAVLLDPATGGVRALVGGRGEEVFRGYNRATQLQAQPGSSIKPLVVYTPALEKGYNYASILPDKPLTFGKNYRPEDYTKTFLGQVPMYKAVEESLNVPAVWLLDKIGLDNGLAALKKFGIPYANADQNLAIALGGMSTGVSPLQMADAFSTFPNGGVREDAHLITKIVGPTGNIIAEHKEQSTRVTSKSVANKMTAMLMNVVETGTGRGANIPGVEIAAKTGSTQLSFTDNGTKDEWMVGYTTDLAGAVWMGYDQTDRQHYLTSSSSAGVVPLFKAVMQSGLPYTKHPNFEVQSINAQLAEKNQTEQMIQNQAAKIGKELSDNAKKLTQTIENQAPAWKQDINQALHSLSSTVNSLVENLQGLGGR